MQRPGGSIDAPRTPTWLGRSRWALTWPLLRDPGANFDKITAAARTLWRWLIWSGVPERLERLRQQGFCSAVPSRWQILLAGQQMMLGTTSDETRIWYEERGIAFTFHNVRRFLDHPATMMDPVGFLSDQGTILHHIFQSTHIHPVYDLQLLAMFADGAEALSQWQAAVAGGTHPASHRFAILVEDPEYHARLMGQLDAWREAPLRRAPSGDYAHVQDPELRLAMDQFKDVYGLIAYAARLEVGALDVVLAYLGELWKATLGRLWPRPRVRPALHLFEPELIEKHLPNGVIDPY